MVNTGTQHDDSRATKGRRLDVRPLTTAEKIRLQALERQRRAAILAVDKEIVRLYLMGVSQTCIADAIEVSRYSIMNMIKRRRQRLTEEVVPKRRRMPVR
jgi:transposase-like protein